MAFFILISLLSLVPTFLVYGQHLENDIQLVLHDGAKSTHVSEIREEEDFDNDFVYLPENSGNASISFESTLSEGVKRLWGIPDTEAFVGKIFSYSIPEDAFDGQISDYRLKDIPSWLSWNKAERSIEGLPRQSDKGFHYITVYALGKSDSSAKEVFALEVLDFIGSSFYHEAGCKRKSDVSLLSVIIDSDLDHMTPRQRVNAARSFAALYHIEESKVHLVPAPDDEDPVNDESALLAGPGSAGLDSIHSLHQSMLQFVVGCEGEVSPKHQHLINEVERQAKNGDLQTALGIPVLGWHVTQTSPRSGRRRRRIEYSGLDYSLNFDDVRFNFYDDIPDAHIVPSLATPSLGEPTDYDSPEDPHRLNYVTPVLKPVPISTPVYIPVKPTRVLNPSPTVPVSSVYPTDLVSSFEENLELLETIGDAASRIPAHSDLAYPPAPTAQPTATPTVEVTTEVGVRNFPPQISNRMEKIAWIAGHVYRLTVPKNTFEDIEEGNTRNLLLVFKSPDGHTVGTNSWIQFDPSKQQIYALPLEEHIGRYTFYLEAIDKQGKSVTDSVMIHVQQAREARNYNHMITATFKFEKKYEYDFIYSLDWQVEAVEKVASIYGDKDLSNINVRSISLNPIKLSWTNVTLANPRAVSCPIEELKEIIEPLIGDKESEPTKEAEAVFLPQFHLKHVHIHYYGVCEHHGRKQAKAKLPIDTKAEFEAYENEVPIFTNQIDMLTAVAGLLFRHQVPEDTCYDLEDGNTRQLKMRLLTSNLYDPPPTSWLQFDKKNQEFFGLPLDKDLGSKEYILECVDNDGAKVIDALTVVVNGHPYRGEPPVHFSLVVDGDYDAFDADALQKAKLIQRIAQVFGDKNTDSVKVDSYRRGSVVLSWTNASLLSDSCPEEDVVALRRVMTDDNGSLLRSFVDSFLPHFRVTGGSFVPAGMCLGKDTPVHTEDPDLGFPEEELIYEQKDDYLLTFIIPAVIIALMLLIAALIACCLYRRRRYGKMSMADDRGTFVGKGIPIIFAEELEDCPDLGKSPIIMKEEKPPLPPPDYQRNSPSVGASSNSPQLPGHHPNSAEDTPYQPPPPFTTNSGGSRNSRPAMPPTYRKPPTYVPP